MLPCCEADSTRASVFDPAADPVSSWLVAIAWPVGAALAGLALVQVVTLLVLATWKRRETAGGESDGSATGAHDLVRRLRLPISCVVPLLCALWALGPAALPAQFDAVIRHTLAVLLIAGSTWLLTRLVSGAVGAVLRRYDVGVRDNLAARRMHTRVGVVGRIANALLWGLGIAAILMTFPSVRQVGTAILASAGIAGVVLGMAAQRTVGNFLAGLQIAWTQPIRLDDAVVIAGEWGWIEEITTTYVVVRIWDERRLIVPFTTLLEQPFQNWTRTTARILGQVSIWVDYRVPVNAVREELQRILRETELWDRRTAVLQVVDANERSIHLRALVSAADSPSAWDLRCYVRERLIDFLQDQHPDALPRVRASVARGDRRARDHRGEQSAVGGRDRAASTPDVGGVPNAPPPPDAGIDRGGPGRDG